MENPLEQFKHLIAGSASSIRYTPYSDEVDFREIPFLTQLLGDGIIVPGTNADDPFAWAEKCIAYFSDAKPCILIPGRQFDTYGTRHGRGGGWYDRFLSALPANWLRVGIADAAQISPVRLVRQAWDEPVDWLIVRDGSSWRVYETGARHR